MNRFDEREINAVTDVIRSGKLSPFFSSFLGGEQVQSFEIEFAEYIGVKHAVSVSNGTVALEIALKALGIGKGDEVITTPLSFCATATAILAVGATPVFADIGYTLTLDSNRVREAATFRTKAIIPVSLLGYPAEIPHIIGNDGINNIPVIEDAAQALGATVSGDKKVGSRATLSTFSFQESKSISTLGEGGMITTDDDQLADKCRHIRNHGNVYGTHNKYWDFICTNARMTEAQAAFGRVQLSKLDEINKTIIENIKYFIKHIEKPPSSIMRPVFQISIYPHLLIPFFLHKDVNRDNLLGYLTAKGISKGIPGQNVGYYKQLIYDLSIFKKYHPNTSSFFHKKPQCPIAESLIKKIILFDIHRWQDHSLIDKCLKALKEYEVN